MSDQEKSGYNVAEKSSVVVVVEGEPSTGSRHKPFRPTELQDNQPDLPHKRSKAPAVPSLAEKLKNVSAEHSATTIPDDKSERREPEQIEVHTGIGQSASVASSGKQTHLIAKKSSSKTRDPTSSIETIELETVDVEPMREKLSILAQPIPPDMKLATSAVSVIALPKPSAEKIPDKDSITDEIAELQTPETTKISEWSDEEDAGGLPRSDSRASRVSRAVRQLLCCGVAYSPPSEDEIAGRRWTSGI